MQFIMLNGDGNYPDKNHFNSPQASAEKQFLMEKALNR